MMSSFSISIIIVGILVLVGVTSASSPPTLSPNTTQRFQEMIGVGAALTESSVLAISSIQNKTAQANLLRALFSPERAPFSSSEEGEILGGNFAAVRVPISASDFSLSYWSYDDNNNGPDPNLVNFSISQSLRDGTVAMLREIRKIRPDVFIVATPWTAPAWLKKQPASLCGGAFASTDVENFRIYARFLVRVAIAFQSAYGIPLSAITLQNEPLNNNGGYPTMQLSADEEALLARAVIQEMELREKEFTIAPAPKILLFDHNWHNVEYPIQVLSSLLSSLSQVLVSKHVLGAAFHCYAGQPSQQMEFKSRFPNFTVAMTECSGGAWAPSFGPDLMWDAAKLTLGSVSAASSLVLKWNIALNENHGPKASGGCNNCRGVVTIGASTSNGGDVKFKINEDYVALAHLGGAMLPSQGGRPCVRIDTSVMNSDNNKNNSNSLAAESFLCSGSISMMIVNQGQQEESLEIQHAGCKAVLRDIPVGLVTLMFDSHGSCEMMKLRWFVTSKNQSEVLSRRSDVKFVPV